MIQDDPRHPPPNFHDWMLLAIGIVFVAMGLLILPSKPDAGIVTLAFFGSCLVVFANTILRKLRYRKFTASKVDVVGGIPIRPKRAVMIGLGGCFAALGSILVVFGGSYPPAFRAIGGSLAVLGVVLAAGALMGKWPGGYLQFDPAGLTISQRGWRTQIPWGRITAIVEGEYHSNPVLLLAVDDLASLLVEPPEARVKAYKAIAHSQTWMGAEFAIMTTHYGIDLPVLAATVRRYVTNTAARGELGQRLL